MSGTLLDGYLEAAIFKILSTDPGVLTWVISPNRIALAQMREGVVYPAISFFRVDTPVIYDLDGPARLEHPRIQVDAWANSGRESTLVARAARLALEKIVNQDISGQDIVFNPWHCFINAIEVEDVRGPLFEAPTKTFHSMVDAIVWLND